VSKDSDQTEAAPRKFTLGPLGNLNQVTKGLAKTIRAMADGTLDSIERGSPWENGYIESFNARLFR
jgi:hypothetical protein